MSARRLAMDGADAGVRRVAGGGDVARPAIPAPACDAGGHCITCSDEGTPMRVLELVGDGVALCRSGDGGCSEVLTGVIGEVGPGDVLLVHAGTALTRLADSESSEPVASPAPPGQNAAGPQAGA